MKNFLFTKLQSLFEYRNEMRQLIDILKGVDHWEATDAAIALGKLGDVRAVPALIETIKKIDIIQAQIHEKARNTRDNRDIVGAATLSVDADKFRDACLQALESIGSESAVGFLQGYRDK